MCYLNFSIQSFQRAVADWEVASITECILLQKEMKYNILILMDNINIVVYGESYVNGNGILELVSVIKAQSTFFLLKRISRWINEYSTSKQLAVVIITNQYLCN